MPLDARNIVLTGFMGTGKTTVGRLLAARLGYEFVDTDEVIEQRHGKIAKIFRLRGEEAFRQIERQLAAELAGRDRLVISTGGRLMLDPLNVASLSRNGRVFCLVATPEEIIERITKEGSAVERPLLSAAHPLQQIVELLAERDAAYRHFAQVATGSIEPEVVADRLAALVRADPQRFAIDGPNGAYEVTVGAAILPHVRQLADIDGPMVVVTDRQIGDLFLASLGDVDLTITLADDQGRHNALAAAQHVGDALLDADIDRSATIVALGGSIVGDVAGVAAATYLGGFDLVHCPTDLTAMVDTGSRARKKQTRAVVVDVVTLQTGLAQVDSLSRLQDLVAQAIQANIVRSSTAHAVSHEGDDGVGRDIDGDGRDVDDEIGEGQDEWLSGR